MVITPPLKANKKFDKFFDFRKNIIDKIVIKKITWTVGACLDKNENPVKSELKTNKDYFFYKLLK